MQKGVQRNEWNWQRSAWALQHRHEALKARWEEGEERGRPWCLGGAL